MYSQKLWITARTSNRNSVSQKPPISFFVVQENIHRNIRDSSEINIMFYVTELVFFLLEFYFFRLIYELVSSNSNVFSNYYNYFWDVQYLNGYRTLSYAIIKNNK